MRYVHFRYSNAMEANSSYWCEFFTRWPAELPRRGLLVTSFNEQIMFATFSPSSHVLLLERQTPDSLGARTVVVPYEQISAVKFTDVVKTRLFKSLGFSVPAE